MPNYSADLLQAAKENNTGSALLALRQGIQTDNIVLVKDTSWSHSGWTALHWAAYHNNDELVKAILSERKFANAYLEKTAKPWFFGFFGFNGSQMPGHLVRKKLDQKSEQQTDAQTVKTFNIKIKDEKGWEVFYHGRDAQGHCVADSYTKELILSAEKKLHNKMRDKYEKSGQVLDSMVDNVKRGNLKSALNDGVKYFVENGISKEDMDRIIEFGQKIKEFKI